MNIINFSCGKEGGKHEDKIFIAATDGRRLHIVWFPAKDDPCVKSELENHEMGSYSVKVNAKEIIILKPEDVVYPNWRGVISEDAVVQPSQQLEWTALSELIEADFTPERLSESIFALSKVDILINHKFVEDLGTNSFLVYQFQNDPNKAVLFSQQRNTLAKSAILMPMQKDSTNTFLKRPDSENKISGNGEEAEKRANEEVA
jgi:hypothetical protein